MSLTIVRCRTCGFPHAFCECPAIMAKAIATGRVHRVNWGWGYQIDGSGGSSTYEDVIIWYKEVYEQ